MELKFNQIDYTYRVNPKVEKEERSIFFWKKKEYVKAKL